MVKLNISLNLHKAIIPWTVSMQTLKTCSFIHCYAKTIL